MRRQRLSYLQQKSHNLPHERDDGTMYSLVFLATHHIFTFFIVYFFQLFIVKKVMAAKIMESINGPHCLIFVCKIG